MAQYVGENKSIDRARELSIWPNMEDDIIKYVKSCDVCQTQKLTRVKRKVEGIIPDTPTDPYDKIAMDIFGPLPMTNKGHNYILSIQDMLTKYLVLIPLKNTTSETIVESLLDHYIYIWIT